ncbi:MAG TPA: PE-PPE domain-containing protein, partial [Mycobacterium sp.]|nr:PE-PPE domain-containing protein [Mycobacterium sp.]
MRVFVRSVAAVCLALLGTVVLVVAWTAATAVQLAATALIMGGSFHPLSTPPDDPVGYINPYMANAVNGFINPAAALPSGTGNPGIASVGPADAWYAVITPEEFFPIFGSMTLDDSVQAGLANLSSCVRGTGCVYNDDAQIDPQAPAGPPVAGDEFDIFGYSQSAMIASLLKRDLIENPGETPPVVSFFLLANPMRPNGGILARGFRGMTIPLIGITFHGATPTNSCDVGDCMPTVDAAAQYDIFGGDAPASLTNVLAIANAVLGYVYLHGELQNANFDGALYQGSHGDTDYYLYPTARLPLLRPFEGFVPSPILTALNAPLQAAIEGAYRRDVNPGIVTGMTLLPFHNPVQTILNILRAIPTGIDDALAEATGDPTFRPLGTSPSTSPFGVGGPDLPAAPEAALAGAEDEG